MNDQRMPIAYDITQTYFNLVDLCNKQRKISKALLQYQSSENEIDEESLNLNPLADISKPDGYEIKFPLESTLAQNEESTFQTKNESEIHRPTTSGSVDNLLSPTTRSLSSISISNPFGRELGSYDCVSSLGNRFPLELTTGKLSAEGSSGEYNYITEHHRKKDKVRPFHSLVRPWDSANSPSSSESEDYSLLGAKGISLIRYGNLELNASEANVLSKSQENNEHLYGLRTEETGQMQPSPHTLHESMASYYSRQGDSNGISSGEENCSDMENGSEVEESCQTQNLKKKYWETGMNSSDAEGSAGTAAPLSPNQEKDFSGTPFSEAERASSSSSPTLPATFFGSMLQNPAGHFPSPLTATPVIGGLPLSVPPLIEPCNPNPANQDMLIRAIAAARGPRKQRGEKKPIPNALKDKRYFERRKRNNAAAKKSRDARKRREDETARKAAILEHENLFLKKQIAILKAKYSYLLATALKKNADSQSQDSKNNRSNQPVANFFYGANFKEGENSNF